MNTTAVTTGTNVRPRLWLEWSWVASAFLAIASTIVYAAELLKRHELFRTATFDLGLLSNVLWNNVQGHWFYTTVMPTNYVGEHLSPALMILTPVFALWPDARTLLLVQALAAGLSGIGVFLAARQATSSNPAALLIQASYLLAPVTGWIVLDDFHPITLAMLPMALATWLLWKRWFGWSAVAALSCLLANEDAAVWVAPFGLLLMLYAGRRGWWRGALVTAVSVSLLLIYIALVAPAIRPNVLTDVPAPAVGAWSRCGETAQDLVRCVFADPRQTIRDATSPSDLNAVEGVFGPTLGLGIIGASALAAIPRWLVMLLGNEPSHFRGHYSAMLVPAAYLGAAEAIRLLRRLRVPPALPAALMFVYVLVLFPQASPLLLGGAAPVLNADDYARARNLESAVRLVPADPSVTVAATDNALAHLASRNGAFLIDSSDVVPDYRVVEPWNSYPLSGDDLKHRVALWRVDPRYSIIRDQDGVIVFKHQPTEPARLLSAKFDDLITLTGYSLETDSARLTLALFWRLERQAPVDYHYFVQLQDSDGKGIAQRDGELAEGYLKATSWQAGQAVRETVRLDLPAGASLDFARILTGWYDLRTGVRLELPSGDNQVVIRPGR